MNYNKIIKHTYVLCSVLIAFLFFLWSDLILMSFGIFVFFDTLFSKIISNQVFTIVSKKVFHVLKYAVIILTPILIAVFIRTFFFDLYFVPSSSMERSLMPNDYVLVNKFYYGTKVPKQMNDVPIFGGLFKTSNNTKANNLFKPLLAVKPFKREDIVVFKSVENQNKFLIKRLIGMPGDTLRIKNTKVLINETELNENDDYCFNYKSDIKLAYTNYLTLSNEEYRLQYQTNKIALSRVIHDSLVSSISLFPTTKQDVWSRDNYGPLLIPKKDLTLLLSKERLDIYKAILINFEDVNPEVLENTSYTFKNNYYFVMGDNRHNSLDSRSYGLVPELYIQGKMIAKFKSFLK